MNKIMKEIILLPLSIVIFAIALGLSSLIISNFQNAISKYDQVAGENVGKIKNVIELIINWLPVIVIIITMFLITSYVIGGFRIKRE